MKKLMLTALGIACIAIASCSCDNAGDSLGTDPVSSDTFTLRVSVNGQSTGATRATVDPLAEEEKVNSLYLLFFAPSNDRSGTYEGFVKLDGPLVMNDDIKVDMNGTGLNATDAYKIMAVANIDQYPPYMGITINEWLGELAGQTENYVYKQILAHIAADQQIDMDKLIMTGETEKPADGISTMQLTLTRVVVRFDIVNSARVNYDLESVSIWNAFPEASMFGGGLVDYGKSRIQRFYGVDNTVNTITGDVNGNFLGDVFGGLYTFPNQVISPDEKDDRTTCLIVGLRKRGESGAETTYHRVNINAADAMQNLKRNNVYRLTIRSVSGDGAGSEMEAYTGGTNKIEYKINYWDLDDDGLIQQNGNVILGIPTKRIKLGAEAEERSYDIFAFGGAPGEQIVVSTSFDGDAGNYIKVVQNGNSITVTAQALSADEERTGVITITYAGLTATIGIIQSGTASRFLRVTTPGGAGIPSFPGFAGAPMDGTVAVEASGLWTATLYQTGSPNYFSFSQSSYTGSYHSTGNTGNISLYTIAENATSSSRHAFVLISLDDDPDNYNSALVLTQRALGSIAVSPSIARIEWNGLGKLETTGGGASDTDYKLKVVTTKNESGFYEKWEAILIDDTNNSFEIVSSNYDASDPDNNYVIVKARGETTSGNQTATLRVQLETSSATGVNVSLSQTGYTMNVTPNTFSQISNKGGETGAITVTSNGGAAVKWSATVTGMAAASGTLTGHDAFIVDASGNELTQGDKFALPQTFRVKFPKLMYGNHMIGDITATVTVKLWSGDYEVGSRTITVTQNELLPKNMSISNMHSGYGRITNDSNYGASYRLMLNTFFRTSGGQIPAYPEIAPPVNYIYSPNAIMLPNSTSTSTSSTVSYLHANYFSDLATYYSAIESWRAADNGILVIVYDPVYATGFTNSNSTLNKLGWTRGGTANNPYNKTPRYDNALNYKIADFIFNKGPFGTITSLNIIGGDGDGVSSAVNLTGQDAYGKTGYGVAILGEDNNAGIAIDPVNRVVYFAESQYFSSAGGYNSVSVSGYPSATLNDRTKLLANIYAYIVLTAQYGSNFSDLFID